MHRGELLAELCAEKRLIAVAGTHGKTTTTAMVVWALRAVGADPAFFLGGELPGLGAGGERPTPAGARASGWSPRPTRATPASCACGPRSRWSPTSRWTTTRAGARWPSCTPPSRSSPPRPRRSPSGRAGARRARRRDGDRSASTPTAPGPPRLRARGARRHNRAQRPRRAGGDRAAPAIDVRRGGRGAARASRACARRLELKGDRGGARIYDDYAHHPTEVRAALAALRELEPRAPDRGLPAPPLLAHQGAGRGVRRGAALADEVGVLDVYPAREEPVGELAGVSGLQVAEAAADRAGGRPVWWLVDAERAAQALGAAAAARVEILVTIGAGDVFGLAESAGRTGRVSAPPEGVERDYPLARLTTVRTGGAADFFARPERRGRGWSSCSPGRTRRAAR